MRWYRVRFSILSALATPLQGDTLFGLVCWGLAIREGDRAVEQFLQAYRAPGEPPLVLSDGFPPDRIVAPQLPPVRNPTEREPADKRVRHRYVQAAPLLAEGALLPDPSAGEGGEWLERVQRMRNTIDRATGRTAAEGSLYSVTEYWPRRGEEAADVYAVSSLEPARLRRLLEWAVENGYGADASCGRGVLRVVDLREVTPATRGQRYLSLGGFVPAAGDELPDLRADVFTKFGKVGPLRAARTPFKKPVVLFAAGASFARRGDRQFVGSLIEGVHPDPTVCHHAFAPVLPFVLQEVTA